ncbi:MAG: DNA polymerase III subunit gamma/tau, partial [Clostridia bacterium]|nr:DNA polymerase III subunit gamma/tau [Clostridia bacterium]
RGTGKTSCAKILAKAVNCLSLVGGDPCCECDACSAISAGEVMDIVEIDAASNNSVENIRELREQVAFTPANAKYRVYIIDEVHMLTISAFNALLKTLEEPPPHVIFILATTEVHKLPATILSRCQRFDFKRIDADKICSRIKYIAENEDFTVTDDAASMIATIADGGMRDALSVLDLCVSASNNIDEETVAKVCGMAGNEYLVNMAEFIKKNDREGALLLLDKLYGASVDMLRLLDDMIAHYRNLMIVKTIRTAKRPIICSAKHLESLQNQAADYDIKDIMLTLSFLQDTTARMQSGNRRTELELALIKLCSPKLRNDIDSLERRIAALEKGGARVVVQESNNVEEIKIRKKVTEEIPVTPEVIEEEYIPPIEDEVCEAPTLPEETVVTEQASTENGLIDSMVWAEVLNELSTTSPLLRGILEGSRAFIDGDFCLIDSVNPQFPELMNVKSGIHREKLRKAVENVFGKTYKLGPYRKPVAADPDDALHSLKSMLQELEVPGNR